MRTDRRPAAGLGRVLPSPWLSPLLALLALALLAGGLAQTTAAAQQTEHELRESQQRLEQIRRERDQLRQEMERIRSRVHDLSTEARNIERQVDISNDLLNELDSQIAGREAQVGENTQSLLLARDRLAERKAVLNRRLREIYKRGPLQTTRVLLSANSFADLLNRYRYLFAVARQDRELVGQISSLEAQLANRERVLRRDLAQLQSLHQEKEREHLELARLQEQQRRTLSTAQRQVQTTAGRIEQLTEDEKRLTTLVAEMERRRREAERRAAENRSAPATDAPTLSAADMGTLAWPVQGRLLYRFGRTTQPNGTVLRWNGIGIGAEAGTQVRAVQGGTAVMAGPFEGYGPTVVLSHGGGYYSLYLYLQTVAVDEGARVARGAVVGTVGGERTPEGAHIEFQIRAPGGQAVDPLPWLARGRS